MTTCRECGQSSGNRLCDECRLEQDHEHFENRAEEMKLGTVRVGPDADDVYTLGGDEDDA